MIDKILYDAVGLQFILRHWRYANLFNSLPCIQKLTEASLV